VEALRAGQVSEWAKLALERDALDLWNSVRKRYRDLDAFIDRLDAGHRGGPGGIAGVQRLLSQHAEAVEADLLRYFSIDLMDLWRGG
jgi:hypothetical protein